MLPLAAFTSAPLPKLAAVGPAVPANDPEAVRALARLVRLAREGAWMVQYATTRTRAGVGVRTGSVVVASSPPSSVVTDGDTLTATIDGRVFDCERVDAGTRCAEGPPASGQEADIGRVLAGVTESGRFAVTRSEPRSIAGEQAQCFELLATATMSGAGDLVRDAKYCYARDGVLLAVRIEAPTATDARTAVSVRRDIVRRDLMALLDRFEVPRSTGSG